MIPPRTAKSPGTSTWSSRLYPCSASQTISFSGSISSPGLTVRMSCSSCRFDGTGWSSEGWWTIQPKACAGLLTGPLQGRYYYLYATDGAAGTWEGKTHFCVAPNARFKAAGRGNCAKRGFDRRGFFEVDTGKKPDWTQSLSN